MEIDLESDEIEDNYRILESGILFYKTSMPITEEFLEDAKTFILRFADTFNDLSEVNETVKDYRFRELMVESESILNHLRTEMKEKGVINTKIFHDFCKKQKQCLDIIKKLDCGVDELTTMVANLSVKTNRRKLRL